MVKVCYRIYIESLLSITDNLVNAETRHPERTVQYDGDDAYLVVAPDKGTAAFSDLANEIAVSKGFWLGDAFASGGSNGYDHKVMGITAKAHGSPWFGTSPLGGYSQKKIVFVW